MTVRELAERLREFPDDAEVKISIHDEDVTYIRRVTALQLSGAPAFAPDSAPALFLYQRESDHAADR